MYIAILDRPDKPGKNTKPYKRKSNENHTYIKDINRNLWRKIIAIDSARALWPHAIQYISYTCIST